VEYINQFTLANANIYQQVMEHFFLFLSFSFYPIKTNGMQLFIGL